MGNLDFKKIRIMADIAAHASLLIADELIIIKEPDDLANALDDLSTTFARIFKGKHGSEDYKRELYVFSFNNLTILFGPDKACIVRNGVSVEVAGTNFEISTSKLGIFISGECPEFTKPIKIYEQNQTEIIEYLAKHVDTIYSRWQYVLLSSNITLPKSCAECADRSDCPLPWHNKSSINLMPENSKKRHPECPLRLAPAATMKEVK